RRGFWGNPQMGHGLSLDWKASAPVIQDGKVVFTAPGDSSVYCLNLSNGARMWKASRIDDIYLAGVFSGKVLLVGKSSCRALGLADGKEVWRAATGMPAGQGAASEGIYYLPLRGMGPKKDPEVCS